MMLKQLLALGMAACSLSGCVAVGLAAGGEAAVTAAQERTAGNRVDDTGIYLKLKNACFIFVARSGFKLKASP